MSKTNEQYLQVNLPDKVPDGTLPFDIFVNFKGQYLCFRAANIPWQDDVLRKLKQQKVSQLYIQHAAFKAYQAYMRNLLEQVLTGKSQMSGQDKMGIMTYAAINSTKNMVENPNDKVAYIQSRQVSGGLIHLLREDPILLETLVAMDLKEDLLFLHSKNVAALTIGLASKAKVKEQTLECLALAGLLHDVGISHMPKEQRELFYKPPEQIGTETYNKYLKHGKNLELLFGNTDFIPKIVGELVASHEQDLTTNGKMNLLAQMLSLADKFDKMATIYQMGPKAAYEKVQKEFIGRYDLTLIKMLGAVLKEGKLI
jgi:HD-GYP domain-containing protein (c-di-GMP phosphodiesterase class II)